MTDQRLELKQDVYHASAVFHGACKDLFGGLAALGTWGAILGPLIVRLWMEGIMLSYEEAAPEQSQ